MGDETIKPSLYREGDLNLPINWLIRIGFLNTDV